MSKFYGADKEKIDDLLAQSRAKTRKQEQSKVKYPGYGMRLLAYIFDYFAYGAISSVVLGLILGDWINTYAALENGELSEKSKQAIIENFPVMEVAFGVIAPWFFYYVALVGIFAATPGKLIFGMKIINANTGEDIGYLGAFFRYFCMWLSFFAVFVVTAVLGFILPGLALLGFVGIIYLCVYPLIDSTNRAMHDVMASTEVRYR